MLKIENLAKALNKRFYYGWIIAALASLGVFFSGPGQTYFFSGFIDLYIRDFDWNRATVSGIYSAATLMSGMLLLLVGRFIDRFGQKRMIIIVAVILAATCLWNSFISSLWMLAIGFFVARLTGQGSMQLLPSTIVPYWFIKRRALAFSIMSLGGVIGSASIPPLNTWLISLWGWNSVWRFWAVLLCVIFVPLTIIFIYNKPEDLGMSADNALDDKKDKIGQVDCDDTLNSWTLNQAMKTRSFWGMIFCQIIIPMITTGIVFHFVSILGSKGLNASTAAFILSLLAVVSFPSTLFAGFLLDKIRVNFAASIISMLQLAALAFLLFSWSIYTVIAYAVLQGAAMGFNSVCGGVVWPNYFGIKYLGSIRGAAMTAMVIASSLGPIPFGIIFDAFGSYAMALTIMMVFPFIGIFVGLLSSKPEKKSAV